MRTRICSVALLLMLIGLSVPMQADMISYVTTTPIPLTKTDWTSSLSFPQFNPSQGMLISVELLFRGDFDTVLTVTNSSGASSSGTAKTEMQFTEQRRHLHAGSNPGGIHRNGKHSAARGHVYPDGAVQHRWWDGSDPGFRRRPHGDREVHVDRPGFMGPQEAGTIILRKTIRAGHARPLQRFSDPRGDTHLLPAFGAVFAA
jgi:hypothetical protein